MVLDVINIKKESTEPRLMDLFLANRTKTNAELGEGCNIEYISNKSFCLKFNIINFTHLCFRFCRCVLVVPNIRKLKIIK